MSDSGWCASKQGQAPPSMGDVRYVMSAWERARHLLRGYGVIGVRIGGAFLVA